MRGVMWVAIAVTCAAGVACGNKKSEDEERLERMEKAFEKRAAERKNRKPTGTPRPQDKLAVTVDGKPVKMAIALAWKDGGDVRLLASSVPLSCAEVTGTNGRELYDQEITFEVGRGAVLAPDGTMKPTLKLVQFNGSTEQITKPGTAASGDGEPGKVTTFDVDLAIDGVRARGDKQKLVAKGTIDALGCEVPPRKDVVPLPPEQPATLEVAGKKLAVRGATIETDKDGDVRLNVWTGGEGCKRTGGEQPSALAAMFSYRHDDPKKIWQLSIFGTALSSQFADQMFDRAKAVVTPSPPAAGELELAVELPIMSYPVKIVGKVTAVACPKSS